MLIAGKTSRRSNCPEQGHAGLCNNLLKIFKNELLVARALLLVARSYYSSFLLLVA